MNRKDFRPDNGSYNMSESDRRKVLNEHPSQLRMNQEYYKIRQDKGSEEAKKYLLQKYNASAYNIKQAEDYDMERRRLDKGAYIEHKEHPEFSYEQARQIAKDHLKENPQAYDNYYDEKFNSRKVKLEDNYYIYDPKTGERKGFYRREEAEDYAVKSQEASGLPYKPEVHKVNR